MAPFIDPTNNNEITVDALRWSLGDWDSDDLTYNPAKYVLIENGILFVFSFAIRRWAARVGQTLTATEPTVWVKPGEYHWVPDIASPWGEKTPFTDGCGEISPALAQEVWNELQALHPVHKPPHEILVPKVFQIRFGPAKGVVAVNYKLQGRVSAIPIVPLASIRPSFAVHSSSQVNEEI